MNEFRMGEKRDTELNQNIPNIVHVQKYKNNHRSIYPETNGTISFTGGIQDIPVG